MAREKWEEIPSPSRNKDRKVSIHVGLVVTIPHWLQDPGFIGLWKFIMFQDEYPVGPWRSHW